MLCFCCALRSVVFTKSARPTHTYTHGESLKQYTHGESLKHGSKGIMFSPSEVKSQPKKVMDTQVKSKGRVADKQVRFRVSFRIRVEDPY